MTRVSTSHQLNANSELDLQIEFLRRHGSASRGHSGASLIDHLLGVEAKLRSWGCREEVCRAGLFHSVYGTESFRHELLPANASSRELVRGLIGDEGEALAHAFCELRPNNFLRRLADNSANEADRLEMPQSDLLHLFTANWLEQLPRMRALHRAGHTNEFRRLRHHLNERAREELDAVYDFSGRDPACSRRVVALEAAGQSMPAADVQVVDGLIPGHMRLRLAALTQRNIWRFGWRAAATQTDHHFWHSHFGGDDGDGEASCEADLQGRPIVEPVLELWHLVRAQLAPGHIPVRVYANGHTFGADGHMHTDCERPGHYTTIYYAHDVWEANWGGETAFFNEAGDDVLLSVFPKPGRLVHFPGYLPHAARGPSRDCPALRAVFVMKSFDPQFADRVRS